jgi:hypothetical protein
MPKLRGLLQSRPKIDEEELALAQSHAAARLASLAADAVEDPADDGMPSTAPGQPEPRPGSLRPPIVVEGDPEVSADRDSDHVEPVDVMAQLRDDLGKDEWQLSPVDGLVPDVGQHGVSVVETSLAPKVLDDWGADDAPPSSVPAAPDPLVIVQGDADASVERESGQEGPAGPTAPGQGDTGGTGQVPLVDDNVARRPETLVAPRRRKANQGGPSSSPVHRPATPTGDTSAPVSAAFCPYCALPLQSAPVSSQRCARCRQRFIVKRVDGRAIYLTEAAVPVFVAERRRVAASARLTRERDRWLRLAAAAGSPPQSQARLAAARLTDDVVQAARNLYLTTVDRAFRAAKREHDWETASRLRREKATVLYRAAGSPLPPPDDLIAMFREGVVAELRGIAEISRDAELVGSPCCDICRADDRLISRIGHELRVPRLPHEGCPKGLCRCRWDIAERDRTTMRRYLKRRPRTESRTAADDPAPTA